MPSTFTIPNATSSASVEQIGQASPDSVDFAILANTALDIGVISGCSVAAQSTPNSTVQVSAGQVAVNNAGYVVSAAASVQIPANASGSVRYDLIIYRVGTGLMDLQGTPGPAPYAAFPVPTYTTDVVLAAVYVAPGFSVINPTDIVGKGAVVQPSPLGSPPTLGARVLVLGHSLPSGEGAIPTTHGWASQIAAMMRGRLWNQSVPGAELCIAENQLVPGGIGNILQMVQPPNQPVNWRGPYVGTGVTLTTNCTWQAIVGNAAATTMVVTTTSTAAVLPGMQVTAVASVGIAPNTFVAQVLSATTFSLTKPPTAAGTNQTLTLVAPYYAPDDGVSHAASVATTTWSTASLTVTTTANFATASIVQGMAFTSGGSGCYVQSVQSTTSLTLNQNPTTNGSGVTATFTGWYRYANVPLYGTTALHATTPSGAGALLSWLLVNPLTSPSGSGTYLPMTVLPILMYGNNDIGYMYQRNVQPFLSALETALARLSAAAVYSWNHPMVSFGATGTWSAAFNYTGITTSMGNGTSVITVPNTTGAAINVQTAPDWPGGYVDFGFVLQGTNLAASVATGSITYTVDGSAPNYPGFNAYCQGQTPVTPGNTFTTTFGTATARQMIRGVSLTGYSGTLFPPAGAGPGAGLSPASGAVTVLNCTALPGNITTGDAIAVGYGTNAEFFIAAAPSGGSNVTNATSITVNSHTASNTHPPGDSVYDSNLPVGWSQGADVVARVPVGPGNHTVTATVQAGTTVANLYFDYIQLEATPAPTGIIIGLWKILSEAIWPVQYLDQDVDTWNTAIQAMLGSGNEFPHVFADVSNIFKKSSTLSASVGAAQSGITSLSCTTTPTQVTIASGDIIAMGSGATKQLVYAFGATSIGATSIPISATPAGAQVSVTSTFNQPIGTPVYDATIANQYFYSDGAHTSQNGHSQIASVVWQDIISSLQSIPQLIAEQSAEAGRPSALVVNHAGANLPTGVSGAWAAVGAITSVLAEPGDILEVELAGMWDAPASAIVGNLDIATYNGPAVTAGQAALSSIINYFSAVNTFGNGAVVANYLQSQPGLGYGALAVTGQQVNGITALASPAVSTTGSSDRIIGKYRYPVQFEDVIGGLVYLSVIGKSGSATARNILIGANNNFMMSVTNVGPVSFSAQA